MNKDNLFVALVFFIVSWDWHLLPVNFVKDFLDSFLASPAAGAGIGGFPDFFNGFQVSFPDCLFNFFTADFKTMTNNLAHVVKFYD